LPLILILLLLSEVFTYAEGLTIGCPYDGHPIIGFYLLTVRIQERHHDCRSLVIEDASIVTLLLQHRRLEILHGRALNIERFLPLLEQVLEH
jgi:hypothetical protein